MTKRRKLKKITPKEVFGRYFKNIFYVSMQMENSISDEDNNIYLFVFFMMLGCMKRKYSP
jgi:hypothetical protein